MNDAFDVVGAPVPDQELPYATTHSAPDLPRAEFSEPAEMIADDAVVEAATLEQEPSGFQKMGLAPELLQAVRDLGFTQPTVVQEKCIPMAMQDLVRRRQVARASPI